MQPLAPRTAPLIARHDGYERLDLGALAQVLERCFGRRIRPEFFERPAASVFLANGGAGVAIIEEVDSWHLMSKFAVSPELQRSGMGAALFAEVCAVHPRLAWRARVENPIAGWYARMADGSVPHGPWLIFWRGLDPSEVAEIAVTIAHRPDDFEARVVAE